MAQKSSLPQIVIKYCNVVEQQYSFKIAIICTDKETVLRNSFKECIAEQEITFKISAPNTQSQNSSAKHFKGVIIEKS